MILFTYDADLPTKLGMERRLSNIKLALKAWGVGILSAGLLFLPLSAVWGESDASNLLQDVITRLGIFIFSIPFSVLAAFTYGLVLSAPLFLIALILSQLLGSKALHYPIKISLIATVGTAIIVATVDAITRDNLWAKSHSFLERFGHISSSWDTWLFALPVGVAAYFYCDQLKKKHAFDN